MYRCRMLPHIPFQIVIMADFSTASEVLNLTLEDLSSDTEYYNSDESVSVESDDHGPLGYALEPLIPTNELDSDNSASDLQESELEESGDENPELGRIGNTDWCTCQNCGLMPTVKESVCCQEMTLDHKLHLENEDLSCILKHPRFGWICLDSEALEVAMLSMADLKADHLHRPISSR